VELLALHTEQPRVKKITLDEFLTHRLVPPHGVSLSLDDMERAIEKRADGGSGGARSKAPQFDHWVSPQKSRVALGTHDPWQPVETRRMLKMASTT
jgi:hypothetical protein